MKDWRLEQIKQIRTYGLRAEPTALLLAIDDLLSEVATHEPALPVAQPENGEIMPYANWKEGDSVPAPAGKYAPPTPVHIPPRGVTTGTHKTKGDNYSMPVPNGDGMESAGQEVASEPLQPVVTRNGVAQSGAGGITDTYEEGDENPNNIRFTYPPPSPSGQAAATGRGFWKDTTQYAEALARAHSTAPSISTQLAVEFLELKRSAASPGGAESPTPLSIEQAVDEIGNLLTDYVEDSDNGTMYFTAEGEKLATEIIRRAMLAPAAAELLKPFDIRDGNNRYKPCIRCGATLGMGLSCDSAGVFVSCNSCPFVGPNAKTDKEAFEEWNRLDGKPAVAEPSAWPSDLPANGMGAMNLLTNFWTGDLKGLTKEGARIVDSLVAHVTKRIRAEREGYRLTANRLGISLVGKQDELRESQHEAAGLREQLEKVKSPAQESSAG